jgi:hypothetical protein
LFNQGETFFQGGWDKTSAPPRVDNRETRNWIPSNSGLLGNAGGRLGAIQAMPKQLRRHVLELAALMHGPQLHFPHQFGWKVNRRFHAARLLAFWVPVKGRGSFERESG